MKKKLPGIFLRFDYFYSKGHVGFNTIQFDSTFWFNIHFIETMLVGKVKAMLQRIYKGDPATLKLTYTSQEVSRRTIETDVLFANIQEESIPIGCAQPVCADRTCYFNCPLGEACTMRSNEQVWTGLKWWPPDITSMCGRAGGGYSGLISRGGVQGWGLGRGPQVSWPVGLEPGGWALYSEVQCIVGNGLRLTDTYENITFQQLRWRAVIIMFWGLTWKTFWID